MTTTKKLNRHCPICGSNGGIVLHHQRFILPEGHPLSSGYDVVICDSCGFAFADTNVPQSAYDEFYARLSKYDNANISTGSSGNPHDEKRLDATAKTLAKLLPPTSRILDIGCAGGGLLNGLKKLGFTHLTGLDPSLACVQYGKEKFGLEMYQGTFQDMPEFPPFDVILLSHVMEHVSDVQAAMQSVNHLLAENGMIYIETPDALRYTECLVAPFQDFNTEHINHFDECSLRNLAGKCGYSVKSGATKTLEAAKDIPYPAVWQLWKKEEGSNSIDFQVTHDTALQSALESYISASQKMLDKMDATLQTFIDKPVVVWGTGQLAMKLLAETVLGQSSIAFWIDTNPVLHGHQLHGAKVLSPTEGAAHLRKNPLPIIIASTIHSAAIKEQIHNELHLDVPLIIL